jgi:hypothetical protein
LMPFCDKASSYLACKEEWIGYLCIISLYHYIT